MTWDVRVEFVPMGSVKVRHFFSSYFFQAVFNLLFILKWFVETRMTVLPEKDVYKTNARFLVQDILSVCQHRHALMEYVYWDVEATRIA